MKLAVLSGKGGAGKTLTAVNLAAAAKKAVYIDCDVEEPNGRLFFKPEEIQEEIVCTDLPAFDAEKCTGCRACVRFCRFNALVYIKGKPRLFDEICHSCGGCRLVCPEKAITETAHPVGHIETGVHGRVSVITGVLNPGEASGIPVIRAAQKAGFERDGLIVIDCPPGSACSVMESVSASDYCILVAEPTAFGFHNFKMVYELVSLLKKNCGVIINKETEEYEPLMQFCREHALPILMTIPYKKEYAALASAGEILCEQDADIRGLFENLLQKIGGTAI